MANRKTSSPDSGSRRIFRCAIYTRKSSEEGLEQSFNSLDAQRDACEAYIASQKHEGWRVLPDAYDDGGLSGGSMDRSALIRLLDHIRCGSVDIVVVYKVDRLTRSLADFAKLTELFDAHGVSFVSVTQSFNTSTSMGRLTLNVLLSFAQFEREVASERIRDKIALSKKRGMWMGGLPPLGYDGIDRKLVINEEEARTVRLIYDTYLTLKSVAALKQRLDDLGIASKRRQFRDGRNVAGVSMSRGAIYQILRNRLYRGEIAHRGEIHKGNHQPIIKEEVWDQVQTCLAMQSAKGRKATNVRGTKTAGQPTRSQSAKLLTGLVFDASGERLTPHFAVKRGKRYHYYVSAGLVRGSKSSKPIRIPATDLDRLVIDALNQHLRDPVWVLKQFPTIDEPATAQQIITAAGKLSERIKKAASDPDARELINVLVRRIAVGNGVITIDVCQKGVKQLLSLADSSLNRNASSHDDATADCTVPIKVEAKRLRCGKQVKLIVGEVETSRPSINPELVRIVSDAHRWFEGLKSGRYRTIAKMADKEVRQVSDVSRSISLAFLAPDIVQIILDGRQPVTFTPERLKANRPLPLDWTEQRQILLSSS